ncbi:hypothetical protein J1N09_12815 [Aureitalea sp. L0-47]|uniref:hypothetical protein n=1 Tax=Aureitalea sp. L0-47 TaxID=2816962 RepID=UPI002236F5EF|nr:hypothetical protein [Aureitalea sp. L0-47]MCW5520723.1 hypothetical protein [Aureitalea sp. L0-47]
MKNQVFNVHDEMRKLITRSCADSHSHEDHRLYYFQKELLRHFFKSVEVTINDEASTLTLWNSENPRMQEEDNLYSLNNAVALTISYSNLEETLKGCLERSPQDIRFYRNLLFKYSSLSEVGLPAVISA